MINPWIYGHTHGYMQQTCMHIQYTRDIYIYTHDTPISMHLCDHSMTCVCVRLLCIYIYIQGGAPKIAKLVNITPIAMVYR